MTESLTLLSGSELPIMPTGYAIVMRNLLPRLVKKGWDVYHMAWQHFAMPQQYGDDNGENEYTVLKHGRTDMLHDTFPEYTPRYIAKYKPDVIFSLVDFWFTHALVKYATQTGIPYVNYFPVDGDPFFTGWLETLKKTHTPLAMSKYGRQVLIDTVRKHGRGGWVKHFDMDVLYHGVNPNIFHPLKKETKEEMRKRLFKTNPDMFVVGVIGKNCFRKQHPLAMEAFAKFAKDKDDVVMLMKVGDPANTTFQGNNLYDIAEKFGLNKGKLRFLDQVDDLVEGVTVKELCGFYNIFDVYLSSTTGEGFGIPTMEAMACATPVIITDYTTSRELIGDKEERGWLIPCKSYQYGEWNVRRGIVDVDKMADALQKVYDNRKLASNKGAQGHRFSKKYFTWDMIADQFDKILRKTIDIPQMKEIE